MSEERRATTTLSVRNAEKLGKKAAISIKIEIFPAEQWRRNYRPHKNNTHPKPPHNRYEADRYWKSRYRLRLNGKWLMIPGIYSFLTMTDIMKRVSTLMDCFETAGDH